MRELLSFAAINSIYLALIAGVFQLLRKRVNKAQKVFLGFVVYSILLEYLNSYCVDVLRNNVWLMDTGFTLEFIFFIFYYKSFVGLETKELMVYQVIATVLLIILSLRYLILKSHLSINYLMPVVIITSVVLCASVVLKIFDATDTEFHRNPIFWISFAKIFYLMMILPFNVFRYLKPFMDPETSNFYYRTDELINYVANIVLNTLFAYSFLCRKSLSSS